MEDGELATPPVALPEVQGDVYLAWRYIASLYERDGDRRTRKLCGRKHNVCTPASTQASGCRKSVFMRSAVRPTDASRAASLQTRARAVDRDRRSAACAETWSQRVLRPDMFSGWGIRTLSADDASYNPVDYQVGSVWPHDNAMIVAGMQRYGYTSAASRVFSAILEAATQFEQLPAPGVFAGHDRGAAANP